MRANWGWASGKEGPQKLAGPTPDGGVDQGRGGAIGAGASWRKG